MFRSLDYYRRAADDLAHDLRWAHRLGLLPKGFPAHGRACELIALADELREELEEEKEA